MPKNAAGKTFSNIFRMHRHDAAQAEKGAAKPPMEKGGDMDEGDEKDMHAVVKEHGPASETTVKKVGDKAEMHSMHGEHEHKSTHDTLQEAHDEAHCADGSCDHGDMDEGDDKQADGMNDDYEVPGL